MKQQGTNQLVTIAIFTLEHFGSAIVSYAIREDVLKECKSKSIMVNGGAIINSPITLLDGTTINLEGQVFYV